MARQAKPQVWQIAAGESRRDYSDIFLRNDVMFLGPGQLGNFKDSRRFYEAALRRGEIRKSRFDQIQSFVQNVRPGDFVLLRCWHRVKAIGLVPRTPPYVWSDRYEDVYGWDLQHSRRVIWQHHLAKELEEIQKEQNLFDHMKQVPTFTRVHSEKVLGPVAVLSPSFLEAVNCQPEWAAAFVDDPTGDERKPIPIRVQACEPRGLLKGIVYLDLVGITDVHLAAARLLQGVRFGRAKAHAEPSFPGCSAIRGVSLGAEQRGNRHA